MKRIDSAKNLMCQNINLFSCPICGQSMSLCANSLICVGKHCFDIARQGYVNMLSGKHNTDYDGELFQSRRAVCASGFFGPMMDAVAELIAKHCGKTKTILDAGCGEGSLLLGILERLNANNNMAQGAGIDISKAGVQEAASFPGIIWCVADIAKLPFANGSFSTVLSILSPSNYGEFDRALAEGGLLVKVLPNSGYLKELRHAFYEGREEYSNEPVASRFAECFDTIESRTVCYEKTLQGETLRHLVRMTPLSWGVDEGRRKAVEEMDSATISLDFLIIAGRKRGNGGIIREKSAIMSLLS